MIDAVERENLVALLDWYRAMGVEAAIGDAPRDRFAEYAAGAAPSSWSPPREEPAAEPASEARRAVAPSARPALADAAQVARSARETAAAARTLDELQAALAAFDGCPLKETATRLVFADGDPAAPVMFVGEAPGAEEDATGKPFVGRAGRLLDRMLAAIGLERAEVYIANVIPWRPPGNRTPTPLETAACLPFTLRQIELVAPRWLVTLGKPATQIISGSSEPIGRMRGRWIRVEAGALTLPALPMLHPAYLLRTPAQKRLAWQDLRRLRRVMDGRETP